MANNKHKIRNIPDVIAKGYVYSPNLTFPELEALAEEIRNIILNGKGRTVSEYVDAVNDMDLSLLGYRKFRAIEFEPKLLAYFPDRVHKALRKRIVDEPSEPQFDVTDDRYIFQNQAHGYEWLRQHLYSEREPLENRLKELGIEIEIPEVEVPEEPSEEISKEKPKEKIKVAYVDANKPVWQAKNITVNKPIELPQRHVRDFTSDEEIFIICNNYKGDKYLSRVMDVSVESIREKRESLELKPNQGNSKRTQIGLLGGAFDPITYGHIGLAQFVLDETDIDEVWFTPCYSHMYGKNMAGPPDRMAMIRMAIRNRSNMEAFRFEIDNEITGGTFEFLFKLLSHPIYGQEYEFSYIIGMDNANTFDQWKNFARLKEMVRFIVVDRKGTYRLAQSSRDAWYMERPHLYLASMGDVIECSSTLVRNLMKENRAEEAKYYTTPEIIGYIQTLRLYGCQNEEVQESPEQERVQGDAG